jgi:hypothetical protein
VKVLLSLALGAATALGATLIHPSIPPVGAIVAIVTTYVLIWWIGRHYGKRRYRIYALFAWIFVIMRAGTFGVGQELLIQGDTAGSALLTLGFVAGLLAIFRKV